MTVISGLTEHISSIDTFSSNRVLINANLNKYIYIYIHTSEVINLSVNANYGS
jgi:hypothetical protein